MVQGKLRPCKARTANGSPCSATPVRADGYCYWHSPAVAAERDAARKRGGVNRSNAARAKKQLPAGVMTTDELRGLVGLTIRGVLAGKVEPGVGNSVANLSRAFVAITEAGELEVRLQALEAAAGITEKWRA
jgi:hypothetical protein